MYRLAETYAPDLGAIGSLDLHRFFKYVAELPYHKEAGRYQVLSRPSWVLAGLSPIVACANKAILIGAWAILHRIPFRFVAVSPVVKKPLSHVYAELFLNGEWIPADATYSWNVLGHTRNWARREILRRK